MSNVNPKILLPAALTSSPQNMTDLPTTESMILISKPDAYSNPGDWRFFGFSLGIVVVVLGSSGNALTVWAYNNNRNLQTSFNVLIANLCCLELIFSLLIIPLQLPGYILQREVYPPAVCTTIAYFYYSSIAASLQNLVAIAINRYVGIVDTKRYQKLFTGKRLRFWVLSIWITPLVLYLPQAIGGALTWRENTLRCAITSKGNEAIRLYNTILNIIYQAGGLVILIVLYSAIINRVQQVQNKLKIHKKASFRAPSKSRTGSNKGETKVEIHPPGTPSATSGDEGIDDYRPSSAISGGLQFRPAKDAKQDWMSDSGHGSEKESGSQIRRPPSDLTNSHADASHPTMSDIPSPQPQNRRTSLWQVLFRSKAKQEIDGVEDQAPHTLDLTTDDESKKEHSHDEEETPQEAEPLQEVKVIMREIDEETKNMRRKKSLSAPTMPSLDEIMATSRKSSMAVAQNIPEKLTEVHEPTSPETSPRLIRSRTVVKYKKHHQRDINGSIKLRGEQARFLSPGPCSNKLSKEHHTICTSMPHLAQISTSETPNRSRIGTISRRIKDQKSKRNKDRREKRKQRAKVARRRHARERQLVYSSLTICIAFAVCILPTSLLSVIQVIFKFKAQAAVVLVISCISWLHAVVNPFIYGYMNHMYRKEYGHIAKEMEKKLTVCLK